MTTTWVICGAGRGVGKTHFAQRLCRVLPDAVYVKRGCGTPKPGKPANFFRTDSELSSFLERARGAHAHIVLECHSAAREGTGDVVVFLDAKPGMANVRSDIERLRSLADLWIGPAGSVREWRRVLRNHLDDGDLREAVCDAMVEQKRYLCEAVPAVRTKIWFVFGGEHVFGAGLARLLENVDQLGTLREAATAARISYRRAWDLITTAEKHVGSRLLIRQPGGVGGGQSHLSEKGRHLLVAFTRVNAEVTAFANTCADSALGKTGGRG